MREQMRNGIAVSHSGLVFLLCRDTPFSCRVHRTRRYQVGTEWFKTDTGVRSPRWDRNGRAALNWDYLILAEQCKGNSLTINPCAEARRKPNSEGFGEILATCIHWPSSESEFFSISQTFTFTRRQKSKSKIQYSLYIHEVSWDFITTEVSLTSTVLFVAVLVFGACLWWFLITCSPYAAFISPLGSLGIPTVRRQFVLHWESCKQQSCKFQSVHRS